MYAATEMPAGTELAPVCCSGKSDADKSTQLLSVRAHADVQQNQAHRERFTAHYCTCTTTTDMSMHAA